MPSSLAGPFAYVLVALAWSGGWIFSKIGVTEIPPLELTATRFVLASLVIVPLARALGTPLTLAPFGWIAAAAFCGYVAYGALAFVGLTMAPASDAALIVPTTIPVITAALATIVGERLTRRKVFGFALASVGAAIVVGGGQDLGAIDDRRLLGDLLLLASAACWAAYTTIGSIALRDRSPLAVVALATPVGAAMLLPLGLLEHGYRDLPSWSGAGWAAVAYLALVISVLSFVAYFQVVRRFGAGLASMVSYLVPVTTLVLAALVLGERPSLLQLAGGAVILAGVRVATRGTTAREPGGT